MSTALAIGIFTNNAQSIAEEIINIVRDLSDKNAKVGWDCKQLAMQCDAIQPLAMQLKNFKGMPSDVYLDELFNQLEEARDNINKYQAKMDRYKNKKGFKLIEFKIRKFFIYAPEFSDAFQECRNALDALPKEIERMIALSKAVVTPNALGYSTEFTNDNCKDFWISIAGDDISCEWGHFLANYKLKHSTSVGWSDYDWQCIRQYTCTTDNKISLFGYLELTNKADFPINISEVPSLLDSEGSIGEISRIEIGKMVKSLIKEFSSEKMNRHISNVHKWYEQFDSGEGDDVLTNKQDMANQCYYVIKELKDKKKKNQEPIEQLALEVEKARRAVSYFYQEFWVICEFGRLSRSIMNRIEFPGEKNIKDFIECFEPLDIAYNNIMSCEHGRRDSVDLKAPKLYGYLNEFIKNEKRVKVITENLETTAKHKQMDWKQKEDELNTKIEKYKKDEEYLVELIKKAKQRESDLAQREKELASKEKDSASKEKDLTSKEKELKKKEQDLNHKLDEYQNKIKKEKAKANYNRLISRFKDSKIELMKEQMNNEAQAGRKYSIQLKSNYDNASIASRITNEHLHIPEMVKVTV
ncbi:hypothetical protein BJ944DRAFT_242718 [Cunninghamella echinulata]|nr:hypothetical protein BJ944DRAFT_242718 [Cunninghamella echinulata]